MAFMRSNTALYNAGVFLVYIAWLPAKLISGINIAAEAMATRVGLSGSPMPILAAITFYQAADQFSYIHLYCSASARLLCNSRPPAFTLDF